MVVPINGVNRAVIQAVKFGRTMSDDVRERLRAEWHLDEPAWKQFALFLKGIATGDMGNSWRFQTTPVVEMEPLGTPSPKAWAAWSTSPAG